jgi:hypothetical protein
VEPEEYYERVEALRVYAAGRATSLCSLIAPLLVGRMVWEDPWESEYASEDDALNSPSRALSSVRLQKRKF